MGSRSIAIRVDAGAAIGSGHVMRCLALAEELRRRDAQVCFVSREHAGHLISRIEEAGFGVHRLSAPTRHSVVSSDESTWLGSTPEEDARETAAALAGEHVDWLVVDHYGADARWHRLLRSTAERVLAIDDIANRPHDADILLDQGYPAAGTERRYDALTDSRCRKLLGPRYALLQPIYREVRPLLPERSGTVRQVLVSFGAHDATRATLAVLAALSRPELRHIAIDVVPGDEPEVRASVETIARARTGVTVHRRLPSLAGLMVRADLAIGAGGMTTWERACLALPALVATIADNQMPSTQALAADGLIAYAGASAKVSEADWAEHLITLTREPSRVAELSRRTRRLTDGHGSGRVARAMIGPPERIRIRRATAHDAGLLLDAAKDEASFVTRTEDRRCVFLIGEDACGLPLGWVRFDLDAKRQEALVGFAVDEGLRPLGVGAPLLREAVRVWRERVPGFAAVAQLAPNDDAGQRALHGAGFAQANARSPESLTYEWR